MRKNSTERKRQDSSLTRTSIKYKGPLCGEIIPPPDKSISHRAIMFSSLAGGKSIVRNFLHAEDPLRTLEVFRQMGVEIDQRTHDTAHRQKINEIIINSNGLKRFKKPDNPIYCGNSGTTMRLMCGVLAGQSFPSILTGDTSLSGRPMKRVIKPLIEMGAVIGSTENGCPPLSITGGNLKPITYKSPVASAQVKSAIILAGLYCNGVTTVVEPGKSRDHTERMLKSIGADISVDGLKVSVSGTDTLNPLDITVPADLSSAAFFIIAGLIVPESELMIRNVGINPTRTGIIDILKAMGAKELRVKESDRIASMAAELQKMDVMIEEQEDGLIIEGRENLRPAKTESYGDHRIAMSMIVAGLTESGETIVSDSDCINTSFPGFMQILESLVS